MTSTQTTVHQEIAFLKELQKGMTNKQKRDRVNAGWLSFVDVVGMEKGFDSWEYKLAQIEMDMLMSGEIVHI